MVMNEHWGWAVIVSVWMLLSATAAAETAQPAAEADEAAGPFAAAPEGEAAQPTTVVDLIRALDALDPTARIQAVRELGRLRAPEAVRGLSRVLRSDPVEEVRGWCVEALNEINTPEAIEAIATAARSDRSERVRQLALSRCRSCAPAGPSPGAAPAAAPAPVQPGQAQQSAAAPAQAPAQPQQVVVYEPPRRSVRGMGSLAAGLTLFGIAIIPFVAGGAIAGRWYDCSVRDDWGDCETTAAYSASWILFGFGIAIVLPSLVLLPIGAARVARSRAEGSRGSWIGSITPFAAPLNGGGAVWGVSGRLL